MDNAYPTTTCPYCGQKIEYADDLQMKEVNCPQCSGLVALPSSQGSFMAPEQAIPSIPPCLPPPICNGPTTGMVPLRKKRQIGVIGILALVLLPLVILALLGNVRVFLKRQIDPTVQSYVDGTDVLYLKTLTLGSKTDSAKADVVTLDMTRFTHHRLGGSVSCNAHITISGRDPVAIDEGDNIHIEADGKTYSWKKELPAEAKTNSLGESYEFMLVNVPLESLSALTNCTSVVVRFHGLLRDLDIPMTPKNVEAVRVFARNAVRDVAREYKPVQIPDARPRGVE